MGTNNPPSPIIFGTGVGKIIPSTSAGVLTTDSSGNVSSTATTGSGNVVLATAPTMSSPVVGTQSQGDNSTKAASTSYVDTAVANAVAGVNPAIAVQAATTSSSDTTGYTYNNGVSGVGATLTAGANNTPLTVDGYTFTAIGQRLLVKNNSTAAYNGIYSVTQVQAALLPVILTRVLDYDTPSDINNTGAIPVVNGTANGTTTWVQTAQITTVGTDSLVFAQFSKNPASYLLAANNLSDVASSATSFKNISPLTTAGDIIYENNTPTPARLAIGSSGQVLTVSGGLPSWQTPGGGGSAPGTNHYYAYIGSSTSYYWYNNSNYGSYNTWTVGGTLPSLTVRNSNGFSGVTLALSSQPGVGFTAPATGTIEISVGMYANPNGEQCALQLIENNSGTVIAQTFQYAATSPNIWWTITGLYDVTASSTYSIGLMSAINGGTLYLGNQGQVTGTGDPCLTILMKYIA